MIQALTEQRMKYMIRVKPGRKQGQYAYLAPAGTAWQRGLIKPDCSYRRFTEEPGEATSKLTVRCREKSREFFFINSGQFCSLRLRKKYDWASAARSRPRGTCVVG